VLTVSATDSAAIQSMSQAGYAVRYAICTLYDQAKPYGAEDTIAIKLYQPMNMGVSLALNETFRFDGGNGPNGSYKLNLKASTLVPGTYVMNFLVGSDPAPYQVQLVIRNNH
jgi:hypothetical protein